MLARGTQADVVVIGLIGERGREVREFIERDLGKKVDAERSRWLQRVISPLFGVCKLLRRPLRSLSSIALKVKMCFF